MEMDMDMDMVVLCGILIPKKGEKRISVSIVSLDASHSLKYKYAMCLRLSNYQAFKKTQNEV